MVLRVQELAWSLEKIRMVERSGVSGEEGGNPNSSGVWVVTRVFGRFVKIVDLRDRKIV